jgi:hypothetical protein
MENNPPCTCVTSTAFKCAWCTGSLAEEVKCHCQLHWILYPQLYPGTQGDTGLGICIRCVAHRDLNRLASDLRRLDSATRVTRGHLEACVHGSVTQEVEVQGNLALSSSVDDRTGVRVWVQVGRPRSTPSSSGSRDTTTVEYRVTPYDRNVQRYIDEGFRTVDRAFDWDRPDRYNDDPSTEVVEDDDEWRSPENRSDSEL